jgi:hypothetical protein
MPGVKPNTIQLVVASPLRGVKVKTGWLGIRLMSPSRSTCLPVDSCFSELALTI